MMTFSQYIKQSITKTLLEQEEPSENPKWNLSIKDKIKEIVDYLINKIGMNKSNIDINLNNIIYEIVVSESKIDQKLKVQLEKLSNDYNVIMKIVNMEEDDYFIIEVKNKV